MGCSRLALETHSRVDRHDDVANVRVNVTVIESHVEVLQDRVFRDLVKKHHVGHPDRVLQCLPRAERDAEAERS